MLLHLHSLSTRQKPFSWTYTIICFNLSLCSSQQSSSVTWLYSQQNKLSATDCWWHGTFSLTCTYISSISMPIRLGRILCHTYRALPMLSFWSFGLFLSFCSHSLYIKIKWYDIITTLYGKAIYKVTRKELFTNFSYNLKRQISWR